jgi:hypothetical protein
VQNGPQPPSSPNAPSQVLPADPAKILSFHVFDIEAGASRLSKYKAACDVIADAFGGEVAERTGQDVSPTELDEQGRYRRIATGWGELS